MYSVTTMSLSTAIRLWSIFGLCSAEITGSVLWDFALAIKTTRSVQETKNDRSKERSDTTCSMRVREEELVMHKPLENIGSRKHSLGSTIHDAASWTILSFLHPRS
jgi:hypothetical protein